MITRRLLLGGAVFLVIGIWLLATYCQGDAGFQAGDQISAFSIKLNITTAGYPVIFGFPAVLLGSLLLLVSAIASLIVELRAVFSRKKAPAEKLESA
jgi:hypothetical protein